MANVTYISAKLASLHSFTTMASSAISSKILRRSLKIDPGQFSTFSSMSRLQMIPHPSTYTIKPLEDPKTFDRPARPLSTRPRLRTRELPIIKSKWPTFLAVGATAVSLWAGFLIYTTNQERLSSSVVRQFILKTRRSHNVELRAALGENIELEPTWWMLNEPKVDGQINMPKGQIDISLRLKGSKGAGTLYFTSVRREKGAPFSVLRYKVITDDGRTIDLDPTEEVESVLPPR